MCHTDTQEAVKKPSYHHEEHKGHEEKSLLINFSPTCSLVFFVVGHGF